VLISTAGELRLDGYLLALVCTVAIYVRLCVALAVAAEIYHLWRRWKPHSNGMDSFFWISFKE
jgi:hypothetical protein